MKRIAMKDSERAAWRPNQVVVRMLGPEIGVTEGRNAHARIIELEEAQTPSMSAAKLVLAAAIASRAIANMMEKTQ